MAGYKTSQGGGDMTLENTTVDRNIGETDPATSSLPMGTFVDYKRVVLSLTADLKRLRAFAKELALEETAQLIDEVLQRVEKDSFTVAVVGQFKRGKSTFINALLGVSVLPTDVLPCSATLNRISYGLAPRVLLRFKDGRQEEVPFDKLDGYITKLTDESEVVAKTIKEALVHYPSPYLQNHVEVFDTPGLNDDAAMTEVTLSILPKIDAAIMIILAQAPFDEYERDFLENRLLTSDLSRVIFVVNGIDNCNRPADADRVIQGIEQRIQKNILDRASRQFGINSPEYETYVKKIGQPKVFGLSAFQAVRAKETNDGGLLEKSRFLVFERELQRLLTERRGAVTLQVPVNRTISTCRDILAALNLRRAAVSLKREEFEQAYKKSTAEVDSLKQRKSEELNKVQAASAATQDKLKPLLVGLPNALKAAAEKAINQAEIKAEELDESEKLKERLGKVVDNALRQEGNVQATDIQMRINAALANEIERLQDFAGMIDGLMNRITVNFGGVNAESRFAGTGVAWAAAIAVFTGLGGVWGGYQQAGAKGAVLGGATSFLTTGILISVFALPMTFPVVLAVCIASILPGALAAKWAFKRDRVEHFRVNYREAVLTQLGQALKEADMQSQLREQVRAAFENLRDQLRKETDALLGDAEKTLFSVRSQYEREAILSETDQKRINEIETETRRIGDAAGRLSKQLVEILNI